jgi:hypothetical protein
VAEWGSVAIAHLAQIKGRSKTACRLALGFSGVTEAEIADLRERGYCGWVGPTGRKVLPKGKAPQLGGPWRLVDVRMFGAEAWQVERGGELLDAVYSWREQAIAAAWYDLGAGPQTLAEMARPPEGYAVRLVAGTTDGPSRLGPWSEVGGAS